MLKEQLNVTLEGLLDTKKVRRFSLDWLLKSSDKYIRVTYKFLKKLGVSDSNIGSQACLLTKEPTELESNYLNLTKIGIESKFIASTPSLLGLNKKTVNKYYQQRVGLLRQDYEDRCSGRILLVKQPQLLTVSSDTFDGNVQFLYSKTIPYYKTALCSLLLTKPITKMQKMAWMLRNLFDYETNVSQEQKKLIINRMYDFVRDNPELLRRSTNYFQKNLKKLQHKAELYKSKT